MEMGHCLACLQPSDKFGDHAISCGVAGERIARHHHLRDALFHSAATAHLAPLREERALLPDTDSRPADVLIPNWTGGKDTAIDVTVVNPLRNDYILKSSDNPEYALTTSFQSKWRKYGPACEAQCLVFLPLPALTLGA